MMTFLLPERAAMRMCSFDARSGRTVLPPPKERIGMENSSSDARSGRSSLSPPSVEGNGELEIDRKGECSLEARGGINHGRRPKG